MNHKNTHNENFKEKLSKKIDFFRKIISNNN